MCVWVCVCGMRNVDVCVAVDGRRSEGGRMYSDKLTRTKSARTFLLGRPGSGAASLAHTLFFHSARLRHGTLNAPIFAVPYIQTHTHTQRPFAIIINICGSMEAADERERESQAQAREGARERKNENKF